MNTDIKILLTDDSSFMRKVLRDILEKAGFQNIVEASDGEEAVEVYKKENPNLVLIDIIMPKMSGIDALRQMKLDDDKNALVISAVGQDQTIEEAKQLGASGYIVKPFDEDQVIAKLKEVLG